MAEEKFLDSNESPNSGVNNNTSKAVRSAELAKDLREFYEIVQSSRQFLHKILFNGFDEGGVKRKAIIDPDGKDQKISYLIDQLGIMDETGLIAGAGSTYYQSLSNKDDKNKAFIDSVDTSVNALDSHLIKEQRNIKFWTKPHKIHNWYVLGADYGLYNENHWNRFDKHDSAAILSRGNIVSLYQFLDICAERLEAKLNGNETLLARAKPLYLLNKTPFPTGNQLNDIVDADKFWQPLLDHLPLNNKELRNILNLHTFEHRKDLLNHMVDVHNLPHPDKRPRIPLPPQLQAGDTIYFQSNNSKKLYEHAQYLKHKGLDIQIRPFKEIGRSLRDTPEETGSGAANAKEKVEANLYRLEELKESMRTRGVDPNHAHFMSDDRVFEFYDERLRDRPELERYQHVLPEGMIRLPGAEMKHMADVGGFMDLIHAIHKALKNMQKEYEAGELDTPPDWRVKQQDVLVLTPVANADKQDFFQRSIPAQGTSVCELVRTLPKQSEQWDLEYVLIPVPGYNDHLKYTFESNVEPINGHTLAYMEKRNPGYLSRETHYGRAMNGLMEITGGNLHILHEDALESRYGLDSEKLRIATNRQAWPAEISLDKQANKKIADNKTRWIKNDFKDYFVNIRVAKKITPVETWQDFDKFISKANGFLMLPYDQHEDTLKRRVFNLSLYSVLYTHYALSDINITGKPWSIIDNKDGIFAEGVLKVIDHLYRLGEAGIPTRNMHSYRLEGDMSPQLLRMDFSGGYQSWCRVKNPPKWDKFDKRQLIDLYERTNWSRMRVARFGSAHTIDPQLLSDARWLTNNSHNMGAVTISGGGNSSNMHAYYDPVRREFDAGKRGGEARHIAFSTELTDIEGNPLASDGKTLLDQPNISVPTVAWRETGMYTVSDIAVTDNGGAGTLREQAMWAFFNAMHGGHKPHILVNTPVKRMGKTIRLHEAFIEYMGGPETMEKGLGFKVANNAGEASEMLKDFNEAGEYGYVPDLVAALHDDMDAVIGKRVLDKAENKVGFDLGL